MAVRENSRKLSFTRKEIREAGKMMLNEDYGTIALTTLEVDG